MISEFVTAKYRRVDSAFGGLIDVADVRAFGVQEVFRQNLETYRCVYFPAGTYELSVGAASILNVHADTIIKGAGRTKTIIKLKGIPTQDERLFYVHKGYHVQFENLTIQGPYLTGGANQSTKGIYHAGGRGSLTLRDVDISGFMDGVKVDDWADLRIARCLFSRLRQGVLLEASLTDTPFVIVRDSIFYDIGEAESNQFHGLYLAGPVGRLLIDNCHFKRITGYGVHLHGPLGGRLAFAQIKNSIFDGSRYGGVMAGMTGDGMELDVSDNWFGGQGIGVYARMNGMKMTNNCFESDTGVRIDSGASNCEATKNRMRCSIGFDFIEPGNPSAGWMIQDNTHWPQAGSYLSHRFRALRDSTIRRESVFYDDRSPVRIEGVARELRFLDNEFHGTQVPVYIPGDGMTDVQVNLKRNYSKHPQLYNAEVPGVTEEGTWR